MDQEELIQAITKQRIIELNFEIEILSNYSLNREFILQTRVKEVLVEKLKGIIIK